MRGSLTLATLVAAALVSTAAADHCSSTPSNVVPQECPKFDPLDSWVKLADKNDCGKYFKCVHGQRYPEKCPSGLHFHQSMGHCVEPKIAGCNHTFTVPYYRNCTKYYEIKNGEKIMKTCQNGLYFSPAANACTVPSKSGCEQPERCAGKPDGEILAHENSCGEYWVCQGGRSVYRKCPEGQFINKRKECGAKDYSFRSSSEPLFDMPSCDRYQSTQLVGFGCGTSGKCGHEDPRQRACLSKTRVTYDENDCGKYYVCNNLKLLSMDCPRGLHFHRCLELCVEPEIAGCNHTIKVPSDRNCDKYYAIKNLEKIEETCPSGLHFSPTSKNCEIPSKSKCEQMSGRCDGAVNGHVVAHKSKCNEYWTCRDGKPIPMKCPKDLYLNVKSGKCVKPEEATCNLPILVPDDKGCSRYREIVRGTVTVKKCPRGLEFSETNKNCTEPHKSGCEQTIGMCDGLVNGDLVAHRSNCSKFWKCQNGNPILLECPEDLYIDIDSGRCVGPQDVKCKLPIREPSRLCSQYWEWFNGQIKGEDCPEGLEFSRTKRICVDPRESGCQQPKGKCNDGSKVAHITQCRRFWTCRAGSWTYDKCPEGLYFNSVTSKCAEREKVTCPKDDWENNPPKPIA